MNYSYNPKGVCPSQINFDIQDGKIYNVSFVGGCDGNLKSISTLIDGMDTETVIQKLHGITCGSKPTSCSDRLATAIREATQEAQK